MIYIVSLFKELGVLVENRKTTKCENVKVCPLYNCTRATGGGNERRRRRDKLCTDSMHGEKMKKDKIF